MSSTRSDQKTTDPRSGLGTRFWNFVDRVTIGPSRDTGVGRRTGGRI